MNKTTNQKAEALIKSFNKGLDDFKEALDSINPIRIKEKRRIQLTVIIQDLPEYHQDHILNEFDKIDFIDGKSYSEFITNITSIIKSF